jgi:hypothetical protein
MNFKKILDSILLFLFRRIDFLSRSIYAIIIAIIGELGAIGFGEGILELTTEIKRDPAIQGWKYLGIRIVEVLAGGSWIILAILIVILIGIGYLKYKSRTFPAIKHTFNSQLRTIETLIERFQSVTALELLNKIQQQIEDSYLAENDRNELSAWTYHLKAICRVDDASSRNSFLSHIESYQLKTDKMKYKEMACVSFYKTDQKEKALKIAKEILNQDGLNERASVVRLFTDPSFSVSMIPLSVREGITFKRLYSKYLLTHGENREANARAVISIDLEKRTIPPNIDFSNIDYWDLIGNFSFIIGTNEQPNSFASFKEDYKNNESIKYSNRILSMVFNTISETELYKSFNAFKLTAFYYFQTEYLLNGNTDSVTEMLKLYKAYLSKKEFSSQLATSILICLNQVHRYKDVLELTPVLDRNDCFVYLMEFQALNELDRKDEAEQSFVEYLNRLDFIGDIEVNNVLSFADFLIRKKQDVAKFYQDHIESKRFEFEQQRIIVFCYFHRYLPEKTEIIQGNLTSVKTSYSDLRYELRNTVLVVLLAIKDFELAVSLIEEFHDWRTEQSPLLIYTECLLRLRNDSTKLLEVLKYRRNHFPKEYLFIQEISIYELAENPTEILHIVSEAKVKYPNNPNFEFYYIYSLYKLKDDNQLNKVLNDDLLKASFNWKQKFLLAKICIEKGKKLLGLELFYQETILNGSNSPVLKQNYFVLTTTIGDRNDILWPELVEVGTVVKVRTDQGEILVRVDDKSKVENWLVKSILGLKNGDSIKVNDPVTHKRIDITIVVIFDKYSGLAAQIAEEVGKSNFTGMGIRSVHFENSNVESISKALVEAFGEAGDKDKIRKDEVFKKYYNRQISFTELVRSVSHDKVLEVYSHLTSKQSQGFQVIPVRDFNNVQILEGSELVIDFTSLPILVKLAEDFSSLIQHKFIISQFAIELIENELAESKAMQEDGMVMSITSTGVRPTLYPPGYKEHRISTFQNILTWIKDNCETRISKDKLNMILQRPDLVNETDLYYNYFIDTIFISHGRTLISDDWIHNINFKSQYLTISLEYYLQYFYKDSFKRDILSILIQNHYVGIRLDAESIMKEFKKPFYGGVNTFHYCLENLPFSVNHDITVFNEALDFVKAIYVEQMPLNFKKETSQKVLVNALKHYPNLLHLKKNLTNEINSRFSLLQIYLVDVLDDFTVAFDILNRSS